MRVAILSDIHLSKKNLPALKDVYITSLIKDLLDFNEKQKINLIIITGDLLDKGGESFGEEDGYAIFEKEFLTPIISAVCLTPSNVLFVPGNHDVQQKYVEEESEYFLANTLTKANVNAILDQLRDKFTARNKRIEQFKSFESRFHNNDVNYYYSNNESLFIQEEDGLKFGFALINDSWRSSPKLKREQHFLGTRQLFNARKYFQEHETRLNIAVFHHPLDLLNPEEAEEVENILRSQNFSLAIFGHTHQQKTQALISPTGGILHLISRTAFNDPNEQVEKYQPGYAILDLHMRSMTFNLYARKYVINGFRFDMDTEAMPGGETSGTLQKQYTPLSYDEEGLEGELPTQYKADVGRIVRLLIGKSLYPNPYIFVRELIQNAVDACSRWREKHSDDAPKIIVIINSEENYFQVTDEGDGMTKRILREHFSVIGKSLSEEYNDSTGNMNLISRFGIGFISTFISAQKVYITTKHTDDERISFQIFDVFKGFVYDKSDSDLEDQAPDHGTSIRVYLKKTYNTVSIPSLVSTYCRHIDNLDVYFNNVLQKFGDSWNTENGLLNFTEKNNDHELRLTINVQARPIIASTSGFLINTNPKEIIPFRFPSIIGGEVNFSPKAIDFDLSRSNIIESAKSAAFRKLISLSLKKLFRDALESNNSQIKIAILPYLQCYLCYQSQFAGQFANSYHDFYTKKELIQLCLEHAEFQFESQRKKLGYIVDRIKSTGNATIYIQQGVPTQEIEGILAEYLYYTGNFVITQVAFITSFKDIQQQTSISTFFNVISQECGLKVVEIKNMSDTFIKTTSVSRATLPKRIQERLFEFEKSGQNIVLIRTNNKSKLLIKEKGTYLLNFDHPTFQAFIKAEAFLSDEALNNYLAGVIGIIPTEWAENQTQIGNHTS